MVRVIVQAPKVNPLKPEHPREPRLDLALQANDPQAKLGIEA